MLFRLKVQPPRREQASSGSGLGRRDGSFSSREPQAGGRLYLDCDTDSNIEPTCLAPCREGEAAHASFIEMTEERGREQTPEARHD
jgi:hypothetical protein